MKQSAINMRKAITPNTMDTGSGTTSECVKNIADKKEIAMKAMIREIGMYLRSPGPPIYRNIMTPAHTKLKAINVPMEMASANASNVIKKATPAVNIPVKSVPTTGTSRRFTVQ